MKIPFVGPSYVYPTINFDHQRSINLYPARSEVGTSKDSYILCPTPGRALFTELASTPNRGSIVTPTQAFVMVYNEFYEIFADGSSNLIGTISTSYNGSVSMAFNGSEICIVDGTPTGGYIYNIDTEVFTQITDPGFEGGATVTFNSGYFMINRPDTGIYQISGQYDGLSWDATEFANAEGSPDNLVALVTVHLQTFLIGGNSIEIVQNTGAAQFPFERIQGVFIEYGASAAFAVEQVANTILWLGKDKSGSNVVWMAEGYQPRRVSTEAIESYISTYSSNIEEAVSYSYQENGHYFYVLNIPGAPTTIVYDITLQQWHERAVWNSNSGSWTRDRGNYHIFAFGKHLVSDYENGNIYDQSLSYTNDNDNLIKRQRTFPYITEQNDLYYIYFKTLKIDMRTGVGTTTGDTENVNPQAILRWSDNGGYTWSNETNAPIGRVGQYFTRVIWRRLGKSRFRIFEVTIMANIPVWMISAYIEAEVGNA